MHPAMGTTKSRTSIPTVSMSPETWSLKRVSLTVHQRVWGSKYRYSIQTYHSPITSLTLMIMLIISPPINKSLIKYPLSPHPLSPLFNVDQLEHLFLQRRAQTLGNTRQEKILDVLKGRNGRPIKGDQRQILFGTLVRIITISQHVLLTRKHRTSYPNPTNMLWLWTQRDGQSQ